RVQQILIRLGNLVGGNISIVVADHQAESVLAKKVAGFVDKAFAELLSTRRKVISNQTRFHQRGVKISTGTDDVGSVRTCFRLGGKSIDDLGSTATGIFDFDERVSLSEPFDNLR